jgi:ppGpp synthetase/RelA/SpoT-type nucleotidyltranferase
MLDIGQYFFPNSRSQYAKAGRILASETSPQTEKFASIRMINSLRLELLKPLEDFIQYIEQRIKKCTENREDNGTVPLTAARTKGLKSIADKLQRFPTMNLMQMNDLIAARIIVDSIEDLEKLKEQFYKDNAGKNNKKFKIRSEKDFITKPCEIGLVGYRGFIFVFETVMDFVNRKEKILIELEIVTKLQHLWASTAERIKMFDPNSRALKSYMPLVSSCFAVLENCPTLSIHSKFTSKDLMVRLAKRQVMFMFAFIFYANTTFRPGNVDENVHLFVAERFPAELSTNCFCGGPG